MSAPVWTMRDSAGNCDERFPFEIVDAEGQTLGPCWTREEAALASAAPDMLEALKRISDEWLIADSDPLKAFIDGAIAKAEGREA